MDNDVFVLDDEWLRQIEMENEYSFLTDEEVAIICRDAMMNEAIAYSSDVTIVDNDATVAA